MSTEGNLRRSTTTVRVRSRWDDCDQYGHVNRVACLLRAGARARAGWPRQRMDAAGFLTFVVGHHLVLGEPAQEGDELVVTSRLVDLRRVSGTWDHEVRQPDGTLVGADRARGADLDLDGRIREAPAALLDDLLRGEPQA